MSDQLHKIRVIKFVTQFPFPSGRFHGSYYVKHTHANTLDSPISMLNMALSSHSTSSFLPNIPGLRPRVPTEAKGRKQLFVCVDGAKLLRENAGSDQGSVDSVEDMLSVTSIGVRSSLHNQREEVILAIGYHDERPNNGPMIRTRVDIYYFVRDRSVKIVSHLATPSGSKPKTTVPRQILHRPDGSLYSPEDFVLGGSVMILGCTYFITDGNEALRDHQSASHEERSLDGTISTCGWSSLSKAQASTSRPEGDGIHLSASPQSFRSKKSELKEYLEAKLGRGTCNKTRDRFIAYGNKSLSFLSVTMDTRGHSREYVINYHLCDDTVDITMPTVNQNGGENQRILSRVRIPRPVVHGGEHADDADAHRDCDSFGLGDTVDSDAFYSWSDMFIGAEIEIYSRNFTIIDASPVTRSFFEEHGLELGEPIVREESAAVSPQPVREVPPHTGFGSEEDSLRSCIGSLRVEAPKQRHINPDAPVLVFLASIVSSNLDDQTRKFVLSFYTDDGTVKILEPPIRNSGFVGGLFLSRQKCKKRSGEPLTEADFAVGRIVEVGAHSFVLNSADRGTAEHLARNSVSV
jgi:hypothetical protein